MEEENILQLIISGKDLPIITDPDLERWYFNSYSRGYHAYMNIWIPLTGDESLICRREKGNEYDPHAVAVTRNNVVVGRVLQNVCDHFWVISLGSFVKESTVVQFMTLKFLYGLFFNAMSKE